MYCDRQPQHEGGITGAAGGRKRRWTRKEVALVEVFGGGRGEQQQEREGDSAKGSQLHQIGHQWSNDNARPEKKNV